MAEDLTKTRLRESLQKGTSLDDLIKAKKKSRMSFLLYDTSSSMDDPVGDHKQTRKIDALRAIDKSLSDQGVHIPRIHFGNEVAFITGAIPEPFGGTPLNRGIDFAAVERAEHIIIVSDGAPDSEPLAMAAAVKFGGTIDVFYVGPPGERGEQFLAELCLATGGSFAPADLAEQRQITSGIKGLLGA